MIRVTVAVDDKGAKSFLIDLGERVTNRRDLNGAVARRVAEELREHWEKKNKKPNRLGSSNRTNFWAKAAGQVAVAEVTDAGATVAVGGAPGEQVQIHIFGGTVVPKEAKALTIPLVREAHGLSAASYEKKTGNELFTIPGRNLLFEKPDKAEPTESLVGKTTGRTSQHGPGNVFPMVARQGLRPIYLLADEAKISADPDALPSDDVMIAAIEEEVEDWLDMEGGPA